MKRDPTIRVSVIMPFLNTERFIREAIESVLAQTYHEWELLLVDDGSTDGSTTIARRYAEQNPERVRYLEHDGHQNRGASASRNLGIDWARGEYIAFLDADDIYLPHKLEEQVAILDSRPEVDMLYGDTVYWYSWTNQPEDLQRDYVQSTGIRPNTIVKPPALLPPYLQQKIPTPCTCSVLIRRKVIDRVGGFEANFRRIYTDQAFYTKVCLAATVLIAPGCWDKYRQHPDSSCAVVQKTGQSDAERQSYLSWVAEYLTERGVTDAKIWRALRRELWAYRHPNQYRLMRRAEQLAVQGEAFLAQVARSILPVPIYQVLQSTWKTFLR